MAQRRRNLLFRISQQVMIVMEQGHIAGSYTKADAQGKELDELFFEMTGGEKA